MLTDTRDSVPTVSSRRCPERDRSAKNAHRECGVAAATDECPQGGDVERGIESKPDRIERVEAGALELVEPPFDDGVRGRTLEPHANAR